MAVMAFISTAALVFIAGWLLGIYCGSQATLDEIERKNKTC